jgi:TonB-linked SusC/RagA family outer membrane protein
MRKFLMAQLMLCFFSLPLLAQDIAVSGKVTSTEDGSLLPGVNITVKGTSRGASTNASGEYELNAPAGSTLVFSFIGFTTQEVKIGNQTVINVSLVADAAQLQEVVVTALGIKQQEKAIGYAVQQIKGENLTQTKQVDVNTALAGRVAGVQVLGGSGAKFGTSSIRIRGINNLSGGNPIYVVDGVVTEPNYVNTDDVETLTVLKGPSATALYGQRGSEGAVVITTKKGTKSSGIGIDFNHTTTLEQVYTLPKYQNEYGGGYSQEWNVFKFNPASDPAYLQVMDGAKYYDYYGDESWGPRMDGTKYAPWYAWDRTHPDFGVQKAFVPQPNNVRDFYNTGRAFNTNLALSKAGENYNVRVSYTNLARTGVVPNSNQGKNWLALTSGISLTPKLSLATNINYINENLFNVPAEGYGTQTTGSFNQWFHRDVEMDKLRDYKRPDGSYRSWNINSPRDPNPKYWDNPYTEVYENTHRETRQQIYGNLTLNYKLTDALTASAIVRGRFNNRKYDGRVASGTLVQDFYRTYASEQNEQNYVGTLGYTKTISNFSVNAGVFGEIRRNTTNYVNEQTNGGLAVPNYYNIAASKDRPTTVNSLSDRSVRSVYGYASVGYKDFLFVEGNMRNDWSSTLPQGNNSYLYGGLSGSFVFSEFITGKNILSFGKLRASVAKVGTDTDPYSVYQTYTVNQPYGTYPLLTVPDRIPNATLRPTISNSYEVGTELRFLANRVRFDANYYFRESKDQIIPLSIPSSTGFSSALINAGNIQNNGFEFSLGGTVIKNRDIMWDIDANIGINRSKVVDLYQDLQNLQVGVNDGSVLPGLTNTPASFGFTGSPRISLNAFKGESFGQLIGNGFVIDPKTGQRVVDSEGYYLTQNDKRLGSILPKFTGGLTSSLTYKGVRLGFSLDFGVGGKFMSITQMFAAGSGLLDETAGLNDKGKPKRDAPGDGGGIRLPGVKEDGTPNDIYVDAQTLYETKFSSLWENWVFDRSYVKLREVSAGYTLPQRWFQGSPFRNVSINVVSQNPWLIYTAKPGIDPSQLENSWYEGGQLPGTRNVGLNVRFSL